MRVSSITPKLFGKYKQDKSLKLPDNSMIVVYGLNEAGKSTFVDFAVTLLSATGDKELLSVYGEPGTVLSGEVSLTEGSKSLTISFKPDATIPTNNGTPVKRTSKPVKSDLWTKIKNLDANIISNLYRVNSIEISNGEGTKSKFNQYSLGDRRGVSIPNKINAYRELLEKCSREAEKNSRTKMEKSWTLSEVTRSSADYRDTKSRIAEIEKAISDCRSELSKVDAKLASIGFCRGSKIVAGEAQKAEEELKKSKRDGTFVPLEFAQYVTLINDIIKSLESLDPDLGENEKREATSSLVELEEAIRSESHVLTDREDFPQSRMKLFNEKYLVDILQQIRRGLADRDAFMSSDLDSALQGKETELEIAEKQAKIEKESWSKFGDNRTAQQFSGSSGAALPAIDIKSGIKQLNFVALLALVGAIPIFIRGERFGAGALIALAIAIFLLAKRSALKSNGVSFEGGREKRDCASRVISSDELVITRRKDLVELVERKNAREEQCQKKLKTIEELITELGVKAKSSISSEAFGAIEDRVRKIIENSRLLESHKKIQAESIAKIERQTVEFGVQKQHLISTLKNLGESLNGLEFNSRDVLIGLAKDRLEWFMEQNLWRKSIDDWEVLCAQEKNQAIINELRELDEDGWTNEEKRVKEIKEGIETDIEARLRNLEEHKRHKKELETRQLLTQLNQEIEDLEDKERKLKIDILRLDLQIKMVEKFAKIRAEQTKPKLHKSIQDMVLAVADEWKSISFGESDKSGSPIVITVEYKDGSFVEDKKLSTGAKSLLFIAMRVAIMKQEAEGISELNFPLLCDDPLLALDDVWTPKAFKMLKRESEGYQIIYFTCKKEIRNLAHSIEVPVVEILGSRNQ